MAGPGGGWGAESQAGEDRLGRQLREGLEAEPWVGRPRGEAGSRWKQGVRCGQVKLRKDSPRSQHLSSPRRFLAGGSLGVLHPRPGNHVSHSDHFSLPWIQFSNSTDQWHQNLPTRLRPPQVLSSQMSPMGPRSPGRSSLLSPYVPCGQVPGSQHKRIRARPCPGAPSCCCCPGGPSHHPPPPCDLSFPSPRVWLVPHFPGLIRKSDLKSTAMTPD